MSITVNIDEVRSQPGRRSTGAWEGEVWMAVDFDEILEESIDEWYSDVASERGCCSTAYDVRLLPIGPASCEAPSSQP